MSTCDVAGCAAEAIEAVASVEPPSKILRAHPDDKPPKTTLHACEEHAPLIRSRALALEAQVFGLGDEGST